MNIGSVSPYSLDVSAELPPNGNEERPHAAMVMRANCDNSVLAIVTTENVIRLYGAVALDCWGFLTGHTKRITAVAWSRTCPFLLASCSMDGTVKLWDTRRIAAPGLSTDVASAAPVDSWRISHDEEAETWGIGFDPSDQLLAVSIEEQVLLFDLRRLEAFRDPQVVGGDSIPTSETRRKKKNKAPPLIKRYRQHTDVVSSLIFLDTPNKQRILATGGDDGIVVCVNVEIAVQKYENQGCVGQNLQQPAEENSSDDDDKDDDLVAALPVGDSVASLTMAKAAQAGSGVVMILVSTTTNRLLGFFCNSPEVFDDTPAASEQNITCALDIGDEVRDHMLLRAGDTGGYIVDHFYDAQTERLYVLAGSVNGHLLLFHVSVGSVTVAARFADVRDGIARTGHEDVIRCGIMLPFFGDAGHDVYCSGSIVTAGEDGKICRWRPQRAVEAGNTSGDSAAVHVGSSSDQMPNTGVAVAGSVARPRAAPY